MVAAQAPHLLLISALRHGSETNGSGCHNLVKQERVFGEEYVLVLRSAVFIVSCIINVGLKFKDSPRCAHSSPAAEQSDTCCSFSEPFR